MMPAVCMVRRNALVYRRVWRASVFSSFVQPTLFLLAMGLGLGAMVDAGEAALPGGAGYAAFLAPGLLAAAAMQAAAFESTYPVLGKMMWFRNYEAIAATPMRVSDLVLGELAWIALRLTAIAAAFVLVMTAFGIPRSPLAILAIPAAVLTGLAFAAPIMAYTSTLKDSNRFNVLFRFVITPLFLFSGVFVPVTNLPWGVQLLAWATPLFHAVELARGAAFGTLTSTLWMAHVLYLAALTVVGLVLAERTFRRRLHS
jgi:lipooligosaccharide transport system permease protein